MLLPLPCPLHGMWGFQGSDPLDLSSAEPCRRMPGNGGDCWPLRSLFCHLQIPQPGQVLYLSGLAFVIYKMGITKYTNAWVQKNIWTSFLSFFELLPTPPWVSTVTCDTPLFQVWAFQTVFSTSIRQNFSPWLFNYTKMTHQSKYLLLQGNTNAL